MSNKHDIFDDLIKSQLEGFEANVSMADWDAIEAQLPASNKKKVAAYWWVAGLVLLVAGSITTMVWKNFKQSNTAPSEVVLVDDNQSTNNESVVKNKYIPTPNEAPSEKTVNEPNQPENLNKQSITTSNEVATKTSVQSTTGPDNLPTNNVDIKADEDRIKGADDSAFSTEISDKASNDVVDPKTNNTPVIVASVDSSELGNKVTPTPETKYPILEIGGSVSLTWADKLINPNGENAWRINRDFTQLTSTMEMAASNYQVEGHLNQYLNKNLYISYGLSYNQMEERLAYNYTVDSIAVERVNELIYQPIDPRIGVIEVNYSGRNTYHFIEAPIKVGYVKDIPGTKTQFRGEMGVRYMYLLGMTGKKMDVTRIDSLVDLKSAINDYSRNNFGITGNVGVYRSLGTNTNFGLTLNYNQALTSIRKRDEGITEKPYNFGLNFSIQHKILVK